MNSTQSNIYVSILGQKPARDLFNLKVTHRIQFLGISLILEGVDLVPQLQDELGGLLCLRVDCFEKF